LLDRQCTGLKDITVEQPEEEEKPENGDDDQKSGGSATKALTLRRVKLGSEKSVRTKGPPPHHTWLSVRPGGSFMYCYQKPEADE
jgi:hypothetical protein